MLNNNTVKIKKTAQTLTKIEDLDNLEKSHNLSVKHQISAIFLWNLKLFIPAFILYLVYFMIFVLDKVQQVFFITKFFEFISTPVIAFFALVGKSYYDQNKK